MLIIEIGDDWRYDWRRCSNRRTGDSIGLDRGRLRWCCSMVVPGETATTCWSSALRFKVLVSTSIASLFLLSLSSTDETSVDASVTSVVVAAAASVESVDLSKLMCRCLKFQEMLFFGCFVTRSYLQIGAKNRSETSRFSSVGGVN